MSNSKATYLSTPGQINKAVGRVVNAINKDESNAYATFTSSSELSDGLFAKIHSREFEYFADEPANLGGNNNAPTPVELLLGSLCACQEIVIKAYAAALNISLKKVRVEAKGELDLRGFLNINDDVRPGFHTVSFKTVIDTDETDQEKLQQLTAFAEEQCPVLDIIENPVNVKGLITFENSSN